MDLGSLLFSRCVVMAFLIEAVHNSNSGQTSCSCPEIPSWNLTKPPLKNESFNVNFTFRYTCIDGYVRKAGTSNLTKCKLRIINGAQDCYWWMPPVRLQCIPDPKKQLPSTMATAASTSQQMTQSVSTSASQAAETGSTVTISPGLQVRSNHSQEFSGKTATAVALPSLVIICACIGILYYKSRNNRNNRRGTEEEIPMNSPSCGPPAALDTGLSSSHVLLPQNQSSSDD
ncbi:uncharacterized protein V6R79_024353 [Siganus canaliculatus]